MTEFPQTADVVIVGGGVIGLAVARALTLRGVSNVLVIERAGLGAESSGAAAGMLAPQAEANCADEFFKLCCRSRDLYPSFSSELREETGIDIELETTGTLYLGLTEEDVKDLELRYGWQSNSGLALERLSAEVARELEPAISEEVRLALRFPLDIQVENRRLVRALAASNQNRGVHLETETMANFVRLAGGRIVGLETSRGFVATEKIVIAAGAWTSLLRTSLSTSRERSFKEERGRRLADDSASAPISPDSALPALGIEPVRGQMLCFDADQPIFAHVVYSPRAYLVPRSDGRILAGSTTEHVGFDKRVTNEGVHSIHSAALEISPRVASLPMKESWAGLRPRAPDGLPVLGPCAEIEGLFYATGHYRNGILLAPITGELIAGVVVDGVVPPSLNAFAPDRFAPVCVS